MQLTPLIAIHVTAALLATVTGPVALWTRKGATQRPRLHRAFGYAWVTLMIITAVSAFYIRTGQMPNIGGFGPVHLLIPLVLTGLFGAFWFLFKGNVRGHRLTMQGLYFGACLVAGTFALLPTRFLGQLVWGEWLGLLQAPAHPLAIETKGTFMLAQILINTPLWVWGLLAALLVLGFTQTRGRIVGLPRVVLFPLALGAFSLWGPVSAFGVSAAVLGSWLAATVILLLAVMQTPLPGTVRYDSATRQLTLPGSWVPMALIMGIFLIKYAVGVALTMQPALAADGRFTVAIATAYGVFSGIFAGRTLRLLRLALGPATRPARNNTAQALSA